MLELTREMYAAMGQAILRARRYLIDNFPARGRVPADHHDPHELHGHAAEQHASRTGYAGRRSERQVGGHTLAPRRAGAVMTPWPCAWPGGAAEPIRLARAGSGHRRRGLRLPVMSVRTPYLVDLRLSRGYPHRHVVEREDRLAVCVPLFGVGFTAPCISRWQTHPICLLLRDNVMSETVKVFGVRRETGKE